MNSKACDSQELNEARKVLVAFDKRLKRIGKYLKNWNMIYVRLTKQRVSNISSVCKLQQLWQIFFDLSSKITEASYKLPSISIIL